MNDYNPITVDPRLARLEFLRSMCRLMNNTPSEYEEMVRLEKEFQDAGQVRAESRHP